MSITPFPLDNFIHNRMQTLFKANLTDFEMYEELRQLVIQTKDVQIAVMYATLGCDVGEYDDVIDVLEAQFHDIQTKTYHEELDKAYLLALVQSWQLEKSQAILTEKYDYYMQLGYHTSMLDAISDTLTQQVSMFQQEEEQDKQKLLYDVENVATLSYVKQQQLVPQLRLLSNGDYVIAAQQLLQSTAYNALLKSYVLEMLYERACIETIELNFYGELKKVVLSELSLLDETPFMKKLESKVNQFVSDTHEKTVIFQNAKLYLALSYPFEHELFENVEQLIALLVAQHRNEGVDNEWFKRFELAISQMTV